MRPDVVDYINSFDGDGFNQKIENACLFFMAEYDKQMSLVEHLLDEKRQLLDDISRLRRLQSNLVRVQQYLDYVDIIVRQDMPTIDDVSR